MNLIFRNKFALICAITIVSLLLRPIVINAYATGQPQKKVFVLNSFNRGYTWADNMLRGIDDTFNSSGIKVEKYVRFMDMKRIAPTPEYFLQFKELIRLGYKDVHFDSVLACDNDALEFMRKYRDELFPGVPVVFSSINNYDKKMLDGRTDITGTSENTDYTGTIKIAIKLLPATKNIVVVIDNTTTGKAHRAAIEKIRPDFSENLVFTYLSLGDLTLDELIKKLSMLKNDSIVLLLHHFIDRNGTTYTVQESTPLITRSSSVPVFILSDTRMGMGALGGHVVSGYHHGEAAAQMVVSILKGTDVKSIPVLLDSPNRYMFDYSVMQRFKIAESKLPKESILINMPISILDNYKTQILSILALFIVLSGILVFLLFEIKHRRRIETALRESDEKHRLLFESAGDAIFIHDADAQMLAINQKACKLLGYTHEELMSMTIDQVDTPKEARHAPDRISRLMSQGHLTFETVHQCKDSSPVPVEVSAQRINWEGRAAMMSICRDITERKRAEEELRFQSEIMTNMAEAVYLVRMEDGVIVYTNSIFEKMFGYRQGELHGKHVSIINAPTDKNPEETAGNIMAILHETGRWQGEVNNIRKDGSIFWCYASVSVFDHSKFGRVLVSIHTDITENKLALSEKENLKSHLQQSQKMESIGILAGGIAHDFNNILSPIIGYAEILHEDLPQGSPEQGSVTEILHAALRAKDLVKQILAFSRQSNQELKPVRLQSILKEALKLLKSSIPTTIDIQTDIDSDCGMVVADATQIHQVIMNLATNAYHAMQESGGQLKVVLNQTEIKFSPLGFSDLLPGKYALLKVIDTGIGIKKDVMNKIFDPYFTTKKTGKGTGLGLSVVQGIVKSCNGDIHVYSEPDKGTEFHVYLPIMKKHSEIDSPDPSEPIQGGTEKILLVDDEEMIVKMEKQMLERMGYHVTSRTGSLEALEAFKANPDIFDLIISDMTMPNMTGVQLANEIKAVRMEIPFIICTGFSDQINEETSKKLGIQGYVMKPMIKREIARTIRDVLNIKILTR